MKERNKRRMGFWSLTLLLALAAMSLPDARSLANLPPDETPGEVGLEIKLPNDPGGRTPGLVDPGGGGRSGDSRGAANPDDFSVNSPGMRQPDVKVEAVPAGLLRLIARMQHLLLRILNPAL